jgi:hypothetical protein
MTTGKEFEAVFITPIDVRSMAEYLGIDAAREPALMWIAKFALTEPLPIEWEEIVEEQGVRWRNVVTRDIRSPPLHSLSLSLLPLNPKPLEPAVNQKSVLTPDPSDQHPGDQQFLKMIQEERALSKSSRSRHPVCFLEIQPTCVVF